MAATTRVSSFQEINDSKGKEESRRKKKKKWGQPFFFPLFARMLFCNPQNGQKLMEWAGACQHFLKSFVVAASPPHPHSFFRSAFLRGV